VFEDRAQAAAALDALNGCFQWPGARGPMVVEWMDTNKQVRPASLGQASVSNASFFLKTTCLRGITRRMVVVQLGQPQQPPEFT
jgi:hypothetical protein